MLHHNRMDTAVSPIDIPLMPTPSTSSASPSVELRPDFEMLSSNATDLSSAHTSPDDVRTQHGSEVLAPEPRNNTADKGQAAKNKRVVYESQISPELDGIKLKIKKSPTQDVSAPASTRKKADSGLGAKQRAPRVRKAPATGKARKRKRKKKGHSDDGTDNEDQDLYEEYNGYQADEPAEPDTERAQSDWATERMPPEILTKIFMEVTYTEGCVPTLVR